MNTNHFDLSLLRVFVAVFETRGVSAAAERLLLTQPTISYGLSKLRHIFEDPLFTRAAQGMMPTALAEQLYVEFSAGLSQILAAVETAHGFDERTSDRRFRVAMSELGEVLFLPSLLEHVRQKAPQVEIEIVQSLVADLAAQLANGQVDAVVGGNLQFPRAQTQSITLFTDRYVSLLRRDHPAIGRKLSLDQFLDAQHVHVASMYTWHHQVDSVLRSLGVARKISVQLARFISLPYIIARTDLLVTLPSSAARVLVEAHGNLKMVELPVSMPTFDVCLYWHERHQANSANRWLRTVIHDVLRDKVVSRMR